MNCEQLRDSYDLFAMGVAEEPEQDEIRAHLSRRCEICVAGVEHSMELMAQLASSVDPAQPSARLRQRILASVGVERPRFRWSLVWAAATVLSLAAAFFFATQERRMEMSAEAFAILNGPDTKETSFGNAQPKPPRGKVFLNPAQGVLLIASNLPPAPSGKLYEMWTIPKGGRPVAAGLFQSRADGSAMHVRPGSVDVAATDAVAVTVENEAGADQPTSDPIIVSKMW